jgi:proline dehydrogenase
MYSKGEDVGVCRMDTLFRKNDTLILYEIIDRKYTGVRLQNFAKKRIFLTMSYAQTSEVQPCTHVLKHNARDPLERHSVGGGN